MSEARDALVDEFGIVLRSSACGQVAIGKVVFTSREHIIALEASRRQAGRPSFV
jgi:hypothetical protein